MMENTKCYCCVKASSSGMDVDSALSELGMLSSATDSRRQYLKERQQRILHRGYSDPFPRATPSSVGGTKRLSGGGAIEQPMNMVKFTTESSIQTNGYQILTMNPNFVTGLCSGPPQPTSSTVQVSSMAASPVPYATGSKYQCDTLDSEAKSSRSARMRLSRSRRFRKPYEIPWKQSLENHTNYDYVEVRQSPPLPELASTPERTRTGDKCNSNASTPEKNSRAVKDIKVHRSRSLDDLKDFEKLNLTENDNLIAESREIDCVSQYLNNLSVKE